MSLPWPTFRSYLQTHEATRVTLLARSLLRRAQLPAPAFLPSRPFTWTAITMSSAPDYRNWTRESLVERIKLLEDTLRRNNLPLTATPSLPSTSSGPKPDAPSASKKQKKSKPPKQSQIFDPSKYSTRRIALKLAYLGKNYNGYEHQVSASVSTIEEELWKALTRSCLISPEVVEKVDFTPFEYSKCGRTDRGVSAFGQVIGIRVRSNRPLPREEVPEGQQGEKMEVDEAGPDGEADGKKKKRGKDKKKKEEERPEWHPVADEINYPRILNRLLPPDIRILAWCPDPAPDFDARFSCRERQYRYFFTQPAFPPAPDSVLEEGSKASKARVKEGWLDIEAMRTAAKLFEGSRDFRNFCKIEPGKQITNFVRRIFEADIVEVEDVGSVLLPSLDGVGMKPESVSGGKHPKVYYFHVRGSAFLWHQIRHMVSVIFSVGQGLEAPSIISDLLDVEKYPRRPGYILADEVPLVLWDCIFPSSNYTLDNLDPDMKDEMDWIWLGEDTPSNLYGTAGLANQMWEYWREKKMEELLANRLLDMVSRQADLGRRLVPGPPVKQIDAPRVFLGGNSAMSMGKWVPMSKKPTLAGPEESNDQWAQKHGFENAEELTKIKNWRSVIKAAKETKKAGHGDVVGGEKAEGGA